MLRALAATAAALILAAPAHATVNGLPSQDFADMASVAAAAFPAATTNCPTIELTFSNDTIPQVINDPNWQAWAQADSCRINFRPALKAASYRDICPLMVHEFGHLAGLDHSSDPTNVMYPTPPWPPACGSSDAQLSPYITDYAKAQYDLTVWTPYLRQEAAAYARRRRTRALRALRVRSRRDRQRMTRDARVLTANHASVPT